MSLFDLLKPKAKPVPQQKNTLNRPECDVSKTPLLVALFKTPREGRDDKWYQSFYQNIATASFACGTPQLLHGPDGFPYFVLQTPEEGQPFESFCIQNMKDDFLLEKGWGVVFNPTTNNTDWVFTHGDIVNFQLNHQFILPVNDADVQDIAFTNNVGILQKAEQVMIAQPSAAYLPPYTRAALKSFLQFKGIKRPKVMMLTSNGNGRITRKLAFNIHPEDYPVTSQLDHLMQQAGWFLPKHYLIIPLQKASSLSDGFVDL